MPPLAPLGFPSSDPVAWPRKGVDSTLASSRQIPMPILQVNIRDHPNLNWDKTRPESWTSSYSEAFCCPLRHTLEGAIRTNHALDWTCSSVIE